MLETVCAIAIFFVVADAVYVADHYLVHHDAARFARQHARHHARYGEPRRGRVHLDGGELWSYTSAALVSVVLAGAVTWATGNVGFVLGALLKYAHSLLFHLYQHRWWGEASVADATTAPPARGWGLAGARYHAFHHARPDDAVFAYAESWQGFDRILERVHPWTGRFTADARRARARS